MSNEDEPVITLIKINKKQKQNPNKEQPPQQINKVVIDYDQVVIAVPHFPKRPKIRINGPKTLVDHTPVTTIKGLLDENKTKRKKAKKVNFGEKNDAQMGKSVISNGVGDFESKPGSIDGKDESLVGKKRKKKVYLGEKNETHMGKMLCSNGLDNFEPKPCSIDGKDERLEGEKKNKKMYLGERNETQMGKGICSNGVDDFEGLNKPKPGWSDGKDERLEGKKKKKKKKKKKRGNLDEINESKMGKGVSSNGVDDFEGLNKVVKRKRGSSVGGKEESLECRFPVNRIVRIIKSQGNDCKLSHEAVFLINKATEKFIELFSEDAYDCALEEKKSFVGYKHLSSAVGKEKSLDFVSDFVPEKITGEKALSGRISAPS